MESMAFAGATALLDRLQRRQLGALELLESLLKRVDAFNPALNAVVCTDLERARERALQADQASARGTSWGPLHGLSMTVKEAYDVAGMPSTWGMPQWRDHRPARSAALVERLERAGAIVYGKTNVPAMCADWQTFNPVYGTTRNPWDLDRVPGGSSGGSAVALAAGFTPLELGSDIGGSIRGPAHYCGVFGHKPTFGLTSGRGHTLPGTLAEPDICVYGPMARCSADLRLALDLLAGPDDGASGLQAVLPESPKEQFADFRVGLLTSHPTAEVDDAVQRKLHDLARFLRTQGATVDEAARPAVDPHEAHRLFIRLLRGATCGALDDATWAAQREAARGVDPQADDYRSWMIAANTQSHRDWLLAHERRMQMRAAWDAWFRDFDLLLCPAAASTAFPHLQTGERWERLIPVNGRGQPTTTQMFWAGYSGMVGLPSTVAPIGLADDGLPVVVQIVGPAWADRRCIGFAALIEREHGGFRAPPAFARAAA